jgi:hypothetical protein
VSSRGVKGVRELVLVLRKGGGGGGGFIQCFCWSSQSMLAPIHSLLISSIRPSEASKSIGMKIDSGVIDDAGEDVMMTVCDGEKDRVMTREIQMLAFFVRDLILYVGRAAHRDFFGAFEKM